MYKNILKDLHKDKIVLHVQNIPGSRLYIIWIIAFFILKKNVINTLYLHMCPHLSNIWPTCLFVCKEWQCKVLNVLGVDQYIYGIIINSFNINFSVLEQFVFWTRTYWRVVFWIWACTWWRLFQKRVVCTKFDIYFFIVVHVFSRVPPIIKRS